MPRPTDTPTTTCRPISDLPVNTKLSKTSNPIIRKMVLSRLIQTLFLLLTIPLSQATSLTLLIPSTSLLTNPSTLTSSAHATLESHGVYIRAPLSRTSSFHFANLTRGSYLATVHCRDFAFEPLRVDVGGAADASGAAGNEGKERVKVWQTFRGNEWDNLGEVRGEGWVERDGRGEGLVVEVKPLAAKQFYQQRGGFSPLSLFKNPMILIAVFSLVLVLGVPYLIDSMDPETREEFEKMQQENSLTSGNPASKIQNFDMASWLAGKSTGTEETSSASSGSKADSSRKR